MTGDPKHEVLIGGIETRAIEIVDYDPRWQNTFQTHANNISKALGDVALRIEHTGSTSVADLAAKPIIDILLVVRDSADEDSYLSRLVAAGYELRVREPDWHEHRMFRTPERDAHIHVLSFGSSEIDRMLTFRDRLRKNVLDRQRYEETKRKLAAQTWRSMNDYAKAKTQMIEEIIAATHSADEVSQ